MHRISPTRHGGNAAATRWRRGPGTDANKPLSPCGRGVGVRGRKLPPAAEYPSSQPFSRKGRRAS
ncbi:hypothetical protein [Azospirillum doebereinerae]